MKFSHPSSIRKVLRYSLLPLFYVSVIAISSLKLWTLTEDYSLGDVDVPITPNQVLQQTIIPKYPGLFRVDIYLSKVQPELNGFVQLSFIDAEQPTIIMQQAHPPASTSEYVRDGVYPFLFSPPLEAVSQTVRLSVTTSENTRMQTIGTVNNAYPSGQLLSEPILVAQDLSFRLHYRPGILFALRNTNLVEPIRQLLTQNLYTSDEGIRLVILVGFITVLHGLVMLRLGLKLGELIG